MTESIFNGVKPELDTTFKAEGKQWVVASIAPPCIVVGRLVGIGTPTSPEHIITVRESFE